MGEESATGTRIKKIVVPIDPPHLTDLDWKDIHNCKKILFSLIIIASGTGGVAGRIVAP